MKRLSIIIIFGIILSFIGILDVQATNSKENTRVTDYANVLSEGEIETLEEKINSIRENYDFDFGIVITKSLEGKTTKKYADDFYDNNNYGIGSDKDGALFLLSLEERSYYISTKGKGIDAINNDIIDSIGKGIVPLLKDEKYYETLNVVVATVDGVINSSINMGQYESAQDKKNKNIEKWILTSVFILPIALIILFSIFNKNRSSNGGSRSSNSYYHDNNTYHDTSSYTDNSSSDCGGDHGGGGGDY